MLHFFWLYLNKRHTSKKVRNTHNRMVWNPPYRFFAIPTAAAPFIFFSVTPVSVQLVDRRKLDTMGNDYICQWHKIAVYAYPGIVNICFIGKNTFHLCENIPNLLWNFASKNKTRMQFDMLRVTFSISNYTLHYLTFAENII